MKLHQVLHLVSEGQFFLTLHARQRMTERHISFQDIKHCASTGEISFENEKYKIVGYDLDNEKTTVICVEDNGVLIVTVF